MKEDTEKWGGIIISPNERRHRKTGQDYNPIQQNHSPEKWGWFIIPPKITRYQHVTNPQVNYNVMR